MVVVPESLNSMNLLEILGKFKLCKTPPPHTHTHTRMHAHI